MRLRRIILAFCAFTFTFGFLYFYFETRISDGVCSRLSSHAPFTSTDSTFSQILGSIEGYFCAWDYLDDRESGKDWNLFYHLGGNGPWIPKIEGIAYRGHDVPVGCVVDQVHMVGFPVKPVLIEMALF